jgi:2-polyprenyl-6-methoxyphenol hydroxylase-like FAD-dependent oxidoreductase
MAMSWPESTSRISRPYTIHPGSRYGLAPSVQYPNRLHSNAAATAILFLRAELQQIGIGQRAILPGDAVFVFPPFDGQGITSSFQDVSSLA